MLSYVCSVLLCYFCLFIIFLFIFFFFFFFFSSRRRHTRCLSDWSLDVCSSDLRRGRRRGRPSRRHSPPTGRLRRLCCHGRLNRAGGGSPLRPLSRRGPKGGRPAGVASDCRSRSEERRVGKESTSRMAEDEVKKR